VGDEVVTVLTDNYEACDVFFRQLNTGSNVTIKAVDLKETLSLAVSSKVFYSCPSTLSYWIVRLRGERISRVQNPFFKNSEYKKLPGFNFEKIEFLDAEYE
jgi:hypothetical protein